VSRADDVCACCSSGVRTASGLRSWRSSRKLSGWICFDAERFARFRQEVAEVELGRSARSRRRPLRGRAGPFSAPVVPLVVAALDALLVGL